MKSVCRAYLDIETTGLDAEYHEITVVGVCIARGRRRKVVQLYEESLTPKRLLEVVAPADLLYTYNGARFDLPFIRTHLGVDLREHAAHVDLMHHCWRCGLYGGLKSVERQLGIDRRTVGVDGREAVRLWYEYRDAGNERALRRLLRYNAEDVRNLIPLRRQLGV